MKKAIICGFFFLLTPASWGQNLLSLDQVELQAQAHEREERREQWGRLEVAKLRLVQGQDHSAERILKGLSGSAQLAPLISYYRALIFFIRADYEKSSQALAQYQDWSLPQLQQQCPLRLINAFALQQQKIFRETLSLCAPLAQDQEQNRLSWIDTLERGFTPDSPYLILDPRLLADQEQVKLWLQLLLYFDQTSSPALPELITQIPGPFLASSAIRELIASLYFKWNKKEEVQRYLAGLKTHNAQNMFGLLAVEKELWEIATQHFLLALKSKPTSKVALENLILLALVLKKMPEAQGLLSAYEHHVRPSERGPYLTLRAFTALAQGDLITTRKELIDLQDFYQGLGPRPTLWIKMLHAQLSGAGKTPYRLALEACDKNLPAGCWVALAQQNWSDFHLLLQHRDSPWELSPPLSPEELGKLPPLKEPLLVDQKDIAELDALGPPQRSSTFAPHAESPSTNP